jgi:hypothetical protein
MSHHIATFLLSALSIAGAIETMAQDSIEELKQGILGSEARLVNLQVDGWCQVEHWNMETRKWDFQGERHVTAFYEGIPLGRVRVDVHKSVTVWGSGSAPYSQDTYTCVYDGRVLQFLNTRSGSPTDPVLTPFGEIKRGQPSILRSDCGTGWTDSLFGALDEAGQRLSDVFKHAERGLAAIRTKQMVFNGVPCVQLEYLIHGALVNKWYIDPKRGYGLLGGERATGTGIVFQTWIADELLESAPGIYYPAKITTVSLSPDGHPLERSKYEAKSILVNDPNFSDGIFVIKWPPGTKVEDRIANKTFTIAGDEQAVTREASQQVAEARVEIASPSVSAQSKSREVANPATVSTHALTPRRHILWGIITGIAACVVLLVIIGVRLSGRK